MLGEATDPSQPSLKVKIQKEVQVSGSVDWKRKGGQPDEWVEGPLEHSEWGPRL